MGPDSRRERGYFSMQLFHCSEWEKALSGVLEGLVTSLTGPSSDNSLPLPVLKLIARNHKMNVSFKRQREVTVTERSPCAGHWTRMSPFLQGVAFPFTAGKMKFSRVHVFRQRSS